eukprot:377125-Pleurochrysis_carterae.AAC.4
MASVSCLKHLVHWPSACWHRTRATCCASLAGDDARRTKRSSQQARGAGGMSRARTAQRPLRLHSGTGGQKRGFPFLRMRAAAQVRREVKR